MGRFWNPERPLREIFAGDTRPVNAGHAAGYYRYGGLSAGTKGPGDIQKVRSVPLKVFWR